MFPDSTKCYRATTKPYDSTQLQPDVNSLCRWSTDSNLNFNHSKIVQLSFKSQAVSLTYTIGFSTIKKVDIHSDLVVILSSNLSWELHLIYWHITYKAYKLLGLLRRSFSSDIPINCKKQLHVHISLIRSYIRTLCTVLSFGEHAS